MITIRIPKHIAIIPDGNRRWATSLGMKKQDGYQYGLIPGIQTLRMAKEYGIEEVTYYCFTTDNCKRPSKQVSSFIEASLDAIQLLQKEDISLLVVGNTDSKMFPKELLPYTKERVTFGTGKIKVNFLVNYGWEWDLSNMSTSSRNRSQIIESIYSKAISKIDLILRWGGRNRLSGLLPIQSVYADFYTIEQMWPDFSPEQFDNAIKWYDKQDITLGG